jgi:hypothetical protein
MSLALLVWGTALTGCGRASREGQTAAAQRPLPENDPANRHTISVTFGYDFKQNPSCAEKPAMKTCIRQFDVYDVSGEPFRLFSIPVPKDARGIVKGITGQSPARIFLAGTHFLSVTAENALGIESDLNGAKIRVEIKPKAASDSRTLER